MDEDYAQYERECERIRGENVKLLDEFADLVSGQGVGQENDPQAL